MLRSVITAAVLFLSTLAQPAAAAVTITFWSHDMDMEFPHAFVALKGTPDAGGAAVDATYGFTAKALSPAILMGSVGGEIQTVRPGYVRRSYAQFAVTLTDAQYASVQALIAEWRVHTKYNLNRRNCVHFAAEAARRSGLTVPLLPKLMKKPKSFLVAVGEANAGRVTPLHLAGSDYVRTYGTPGTAPDTAVTTERTIGKAGERTRDARP